jgi:hypothetical protein
MEYLFMKNTLLISLEAMPNLNEIDSTYALPTMIPYPPLAYFSLFREHS